MKKRYSILFSFLICGFFSSLVGDKVVLADFDHPQAEGFNFTALVEKSDFDDDGDLEGKITGKGYQTIAKYRVSRDEAANLLTSTPILNVAVESTPAESSGNFLTILLAVQTDATGKDVYEPANKLKYDPWRSGGKGLKIDLNEVTAKSLPSFPDALEVFANGEGDFFFLVLAQQTQKGQQSVAYYDDISLSAE